MVGEFLIDVGGFEKPRGVCVTKSTLKSRYAVLFWRAGHVLDSEVHLHRLSFFKKTGAFGNFPKINLGSLEDSLDHRDRLL